MPLDAQPASAPPVFLPLARVAEITSLGKSVIYALAAEGDFPKPVKLTKQRSAWVEAEVREWQRQKIEARGA